MARGKAVNINQIKQIICNELIGLTHNEISQQMNLNRQTVDRISKREDYHAIRKHLSDYLMGLSSSELLRLQ